jgi:hypothetical protein
MAGYQCTDNSLPPYVRLHWLEAFSKAMRNIRSLASVRSAGIEIWRFISPSRIDGKLTLMATQQELDDLDDLDGIHPMDPLILILQTSWTTLTRRRPTHPFLRQSNFLMAQIPLQTHSPPLPLLLTPTSQTKISLANYSKGWNNSCAKWKHPQPLAVNSNLS